MAMDRLRVRGRIQDLPMVAHSQALPTGRVLLPPASLSLRVSWDVPVRAENAIDFASTDSKLK